MGAESKALKLPHSGHKTSLTGNGYPSLGCYRMPMG